MLKGTLACHNQVLAIVQILKPPKLISEDLFRGLMAEINVLMMLLKAIEETRTQSRYNRSKF